MELQIKELDEKIDRLLILADGRLNKEFYTAPGIRLFGEVRGGFLPSIALWKCE